MRYEPVFCFAPAKLIDGNRFYCAAAVKESSKKNARFVHSYLICDEDVKDGKLNPKVVSNTESFATPEELYSRFFKFCDQFGEDHERLNDPEFILKDTMELEEFNSYFTKYVMEKSNFFATKFYQENREKFSGAPTAEKKSGWIAKMLKKIVDCG